MEAIELISQDLFDKVRSRFSNLEMGDEDGSVTIDPRDARFFDFDFVYEGHNLGRVSISINERGSLKIFYTQGILEGHHPEIHQVWFRFLREMRNFSKQRLLRFDTRDITKRNLDKNDFRYLASTGTKEEVMAENRMYGSLKSSYLTLEKAKLIVRHIGPIDMNQIGARSRKGNIKALFIENADGERFKYPFIHLAGAKAMLRHVANGGRPHDILGQAIIKLSEEIAQLTALARHTRNLHDSMQSGVNEIVNKTSTRLENLRELMNNLSVQRHYETWKSSYQPDDSDIILDQTTLEDYKSKFTVTSFSEDLTQFFPLIHKIMQETNTIELNDYVEENKEDNCDECNMPESKCSCEKQKEVKEFSEFNEWASKIVEGELTDDLLQSLQKIVKDDLEVGDGGAIGIKTVQGIGIFDNDLEQIIKDSSPNGKLNTAITIWLNRKGDYHALRDLDMDSSTTGTSMPKPETPAAEPTPPETGTTPPEETPPPEAGAAPPEETPPPAEDDETDKKNTPKLKGSPKYLVRQLVDGFFDKRKGTWTLGRPNIVTKSVKEYGEEMREYTVKYIKHLSKKSKKLKHKDVDTQTFEDILRLSGLKK